MTILTHHIQYYKIAEITSDGLLIGNREDGLDLLGNVYYQGFDRLILYESVITPEFFDLKNGMAGEILQKFSTYRMKLAIVGDFSKYKSKSVTDFILESNRIGHVNFVATLEDALTRLSVN